MIDWSIRNTNTKEVRVRIQNSIGIPELDSVPEPDLAWVKPKDYRDDRPRAKDVLLLIEVSDSTLTYDLGEKAELYAAARIADYWVVNIPHWRVEVFRRSRGGRYRDHTIAELYDKVSPLAFPKLKLSVEQLFKSS
jgi:Uma2 family endonuclease